MKIPHEKFCVLPWISLETSPVGSVRPCCLAEEEIVDDQGEKFDLRQADLSQVQQSVYMHSLRQQFLAGEQPLTCRKCWNEEQAGRTSKRQHTLERLKHIIVDTEWGTESKPLQFLDLKLGNICNLKCRICGSWSSSTFATEEIQHLPADQRRDSFHYDMLRRGSWPRENTHFWQQIDQLVDQIRYIEFTGGEPFMIDQHFDLLQGIVDRGYAHQVEIHYNTNGTIFPQRGPDIWQYFKTVEVAFSIDDLDARFEYQRANAIWTEVCANIQKFYELRADHPNIQLQCCSTVNVFNVRYLVELANWVNQQQFDFVYWNVLHEAQHFSVGSLPNSAKQEIAQVLQSQAVPQKFAREFGRIIDFMHQGISTDGEQLKQEIRKLDRWRKQNLNQVAPEFASLIGYEYRGDET